METKRESIKNELERRLSGYAEPPISAQIEILIDIISELEERIWRRLDWIEQKATTHGHGEPPPITQNPEVKMGTYWDDFLQKLEINTTKKLVEISQRELLKLYHEHLVKIGLIKIT